MAMEYPAGGELIPTRAWIADDPDAAARASRA
jgi:hypothetical protein